MITQQLSTTVQLQPETGFNQLKRRIRRSVKRIEMHLQARLKSLGFEPTGTYWDRRADMNYYKVIEDWIEEHEGGDWIIDIGSRSTPIALKGNFTRRTMLDIEPFTQTFDGVELIEADWMTFPMEQKADLVLCLQVLEHLPDDLVAPFARKVLSAGKRAIISVPYRWKKGACEHHLQDPVDFEKFIGWTGKQPIKYYVESRDIDQRLIALFDGD